MDVKTIRVTNSSPNPILIAFQPTEDANTPTEGIEIQPQKTINHAAQNTTANLFIMNPNSAVTMWKGVVPTINTIVYDGKNVTIQSKVVPEGFSPITNLDRSKPSDTENSFSWWLLLVVLLVIAAVGLWLMIN